MADEPPTADEAREQIGSVDLGDYLHEQLAAGKKALLVLLQRRERSDGTQPLDRRDVAILVLHRQSEAGIAPALKAPAEAALCVEVPSEASSPNRGVPFPAGNWLQCKSPESSGTFRLDPLGGFQYECLTCGAKANALGKMDCLYERPLP